jgi:hypothetical protein
MDIGYSDVARSYARTVLERLIDGKLLNYVILFRLPAWLCKNYIATLQPTGSGAYSAFSAEGKSCYSFTALYRVSKKNAMEIQQAFVHHKLG